MGYDSSLVSPMPPITTQRALQMALHHHMMGQFQQAEHLYRQILAREPRHADAIHFLGLLTHQVGRSDVAVGLIQNAIALGLNTPDVYGNLGNALQGSGRLEEAVAAFRQSLTLDPKLAVTWVNLGNVLLVRGDIDQAILAFNNAIACKWDFAEAYNGLALALTDKGRFDEAIAACLRAIAINPAYADARINLGNAHRQNGRLDLAVDAYRAAVAFNPNVAEVHSTLGSALKDQGQPEEAIAAYRQAARINPSDCKHGSNLVLLLQYHPAYDAAAIARENKRWNEVHAQPLAKLIRPLVNDRNPDRRLRIGYVSPDFRDHAVGRNILPLLAHHDHGSFDIICYSQASNPDTMTDRLQKYADSWCSTVGMSDDQLADRIRLDRIDILVDLALHTAGHRLLAFARKPAPVQVTFAGYPGSTGLTTIDYRLSDPYLDPLEMDESVCSEKTVRLPNSFWCYDPLEYGDITVGPLPAVAEGFVTFGCLNNFSKVNREVLALWARVLAEVDKSRLLLMAPLGAPRSTALEVFQKAGIDSGRIDFVSSQPRRAYLETYHRIDIGLDTFPYNGHTTSLDSLWMGVPVVTLVGNRTVARAGWCQLSNLGLTELAAHAPDQFVTIAADLARDLDRLFKLRSTLRQKTERSPLMDGSGFAHDIESAYRMMWRRWCGEDA